jgi:hypothetical protein
MEVFDKDGIREALRRKNKLENAGGELLFLAK